MNLLLDRLAFPPKPPLQTHARARAGNFFGQKDIILQLWPVKLKHYLVALLTNYTIDRNFTKVGKDKEPRENRTPNKPCKGIASHGLRGLEPPLCHFPVKWAGLA